ncbi:hypothetical protein R1sor_000174 [Riccia sorocarpa]|uniref:Uncharacterized protein n=1 Tax=Riccia sorocarpa TaxID=122646 RepID=A0ABD3GUQ6_9MARC
MSTSAVKPFRAADIFRNVTVKKSKAKWFVREALHVFGARSIFLQSSKKDPVNTGFVVHIGQEKDQMDVLVQNDKALVCYELLLKNIQIREFSIPLQKVLGPELNVSFSLLFMRWNSIFFVPPHATHAMSLFLHLVASHAPHGLPDFFLASRAPHGLHGLFPATPCDAWGGTSWQAMRRMACLVYFLPPHATHGVAPPGKPCAAWLARFLLGKPCVDALGEYLVADPKWKFVERDSVKLALRLGILKPPQGSKAQDMLPHNKEWDSYKAREEARLKAQVSTQRNDLPEEDVEEDPASKIVSPEVDRAKKKRNDGSSQRDSFQEIPKPPPGTRRPRSSAPSSSHATTSERSDSQGVPEYMVPENTPAEEAESEEEEPFPVTQTPKVQPLSALSEVELNRDEKNQIRRVAITRCLVDQSVLRIPIEQFHVPSCDSNSENWGPYQIRACSRSFVSDLKKHMQSNAYAHYHNFILLVDPRDCKDKASWVFHPPSKWRFYVIGGNHSALAPMELLAQYHGIYTHYRHCNCIVYAGLSKTEASLFAHDDNFDAEFMEAKQTGEPIATLRKRLALETMNIGEEDSKTVLSTLEGTFQVAFRTGRLWEVQESIFRKWERKKLKSMKGAGKGKKKDDGEMRQTWWRPL